MQFWAPAIVLKSVHQPVLDYWKGSEQDIIKSCTTPSALKMELRQYHQCRHLHPLMYNSPLFFGVFFTFTLFFLVARDTIYICAVNFMKQWPIYCLKTCPKSACCAIKYSSGERRELIRESVASGIWFLQEACWSGATRSQGKEWASQQNQKHSREMHLVSSRLPNIIYKEKTSASLLCENTSWFLTKRKDYICNLS